MKFLTDIAFGRATVDFLQALGHECAAVKDKLGPRGTDQEIVRCAESEGRVVICFDLDVTTLVATSGERKPSVITFRTSLHSSSFVDRRLSEVLTETARELGIGPLVTVEDSRVRVRLVPIPRTARGPSHG